MGIHGESQPGGGEMYGAYTDSRVVHACMILRETTRFNDAEDCVPFRTKPKHRQAIDLDSTYLSFKFEDETY